MSAFIVTKKHIDVLVCALDKYEVNCHSVQHTASAIGQALWRENYKSVNYRYGSSEECPTYRYKKTKAIEAIGNDTWAVYSLLRSYDYQTCEHPTWLSSPVRQWVYDLKGKVAADLLETAIAEATSKDDYCRRSWNAAPWSI